jgi:hypothetical protein
MRWLLVTLSGSAIWLWLGAIPGLRGLVCCSWSVAFPVGGLCLLISARGASGPGSRDWNWVVAAALVTCLTIVLVLADVPLRVLFRSSSEQFEALVPDSPQTWGGEPLGWVGCYYVDRYGADGAGGVFFRTFKHPDGIGPDEMSYGFAYQPHKEGCPFGRTRYQTGWLFGDWYWFSVSDD